MNKLIEKNNLERNYLIKFDSIFDELSFLTNSNDRLYILKYLLMYGCGNFSEMHKNLKLTYPTLSNNINRLKELGFVIKKDSKFYLTNSGKIKTQLIFNLNNSIKVIDSYKLLWSNHTVEDFPEELLLNISLLRNSKIITSSRTNIYGLDNMIIENMKKGKFIYLMISEVNFKYADLISYSLNKNISVYLILPRNIYNKFLSLIDEEILKLAFYNKKLHLLASNELFKFNLFLNDFVFCINLFYDNGLIDKNKLLISYDIDSLTWGKSLFDICYNSGGTKYGSFIKS
ncbi:MAG: helix-turn-helix transcriptional regulator [Methanobrevibacter wolinii]